MVYAVENYYKAGANDKANKLSHELFAVCEEELRFYNGLVGKSGTDKSSYDSDIGRLTSGIDMLYQFTQTYGQKEMQEEYKTRMQSSGIPLPPEIPPMNPDPFMIDTGKDTIEPDTSDPNKKGQG